MADLAIPDSAHDLLTSSTVALSTLNDDGSIQTTAVWCLLGEDGVLRTSLAHARQKYRNLQARPVATVFAVSPSNPYHTVEIRATVTLEPDPDKVFVGQLIATYGMKMEEFPLAAEERDVVTFHPTRVRTS
jgi:PPOX class probable F420-dependent enzyme